MIDFVFDSGNQQLKLGIYNNGKLIEKLKKPTLVAYKEEFDHHLPARIVISSVSNLDFQLVHKWCPESKIIQVDHDTPLPIKVNYKTKKTLGIDRLIAATGAWELYPYQKMLVIDAGTCVTIDYVSQQGVFEGGIISPGLKMRSQAMHHFTAKLPEVDVEQIPMMIGKSTEECLQSGAIWGLIHELNGFIRSLGDQKGIDHIIITGGNAKLLYPELINKDKTHHVPNLNSLGLITILNKNV